MAAPDFASGEEAQTYLRALQALVRALGSSDGNMEEGSFRCDVNVSVRRVGSAQLGPRTEVKNLNSPANVRRAIGTVCFFGVTTGGDAGSLVACRLPPCV